MACRRRQLRDRRALPRTYRARTRAGAAGTSQEGRGGRDREARSRWRTYSNRSASACRDMAGTRGLSWASLVIGPRRDVCALAIRVPPLVPSLSGLRRIAGRAWIGPLTTGSALIGSSGRRTSGPDRSDGPRGAGGPRRRYRRTTARQPRLSRCLPVCSCVQRLQRELLFSHVGQLPVERHPGRCSSTGALCRSTLPGSSRMRRSSCTRRHRLDRRPQIVRAQGDETLIVPAIRSSVKWRDGMGASALLS
jgi:hypothetical protein